MHSPRHSPSFSSIRSSSPGVGHSTLEHIQNAGDSTLYEVAATGKKPAHWMRSLKKTSSLKPRGHRSYSTTSLRRASTSSLGRRLSSLGKQQSPMIMSMGSQGSSSIGSSVYDSPIKRQNKILTRAITHAQSKFARR